MKNDMDSRFFTNYNQCRVAADKHGTQYLNNKACLDDSYDTVFDATVAWLG
jgi:hypothetical protein